MDSGMAHSLTFWAIALLMTGVALGFVLPRLFLRRPPSKTASPDAANVAAYREALADLERDLGAGAIDDADYLRSRQDLERRLLAEVRTDRVDLRQIRATPPAAVALGIVLPALAFGLYAWFGDPAALSRDDAPAPALVAGAAARPDALRAELVAHLARSPGDGRSWVLLARLDFEADRFADAAAAYEKAIAASPKVARDAAVWCEFADALGMAQGGSLAGRPRELIGHALTLDATNARALELAGSAAFEQNDPGAAAGYWRQLLAQLPAGSGQSRELAAAVARAEQLAAAGGAPPVQSTRRSPQ